MNTGLPLSVDRNRIRGRWHVCEPALSKDMCLINEVAKRKRPDMRGKVDAVQSQLN